MVIVNTNRILKENALFFRVIPAGLMALCWYTEKKPIVLMYCLRNQR